MQFDTVYGIDTEANSSSAVTGIGPVWCLFQIKHRRLVGSDIARYLQSIERFAPEIDRPTLFVMVPAATGFENADLCACPAEAKCTCRQFQG